MTQPVYAKKNSDPVRVGVAGLGEIGAVHLSALKQLDNCKVLGVCDPRQDVAQRVAAETGANAYGDVTDLISKETLDLLLVLTPAGTHNEIAQMAAAAGVDVFCEKPMSITLADAQAMAEACKQEGVRLFYGSSYRYLPAIQAARDIVQAGTLGKIQILSETVVTGHGLAGYRPLSTVHYPLGGPGGPGMSLIDHGIHLVDVFSWTLGERPSHVQGHGLRSGDSAGTEYLLAHYPSGALGHLLYNNATFTTAMPNEGIFAGGDGWGNDGQYVAAGGWLSDPGSISIWGTEGSLRIFHYANAVFLNLGDGPQRVELSGRPSPGHFVTQMEAVVAAIQSGKEPECGAADGIAALSTILTATAANETG
ncbi:MAG: Gfo/Idh/MocA family oxidoreductase [Roseovarius sp.]